MELPGEGSGYDLSVVTIHSAMFRAYWRLFRASRQSYTAEKRLWEWKNDLPSYALYRPLSMLVAPLFLAAGVSASGVTMLGLIVCFALPLAVWLGGENGAMVLVALTLLANVLDCADGTVARVTGEMSAVGQMLDGLGNVVLWACYYLAAGVLAQTRAGNAFGGHSLTLSLGAAALLLLQHEMVDRFEFAFPGRMWGPYVPQASKVTTRDLLRLAHVWEQVVVLAGPIVAAATGTLGWYLLAVSGYQALSTLTWIPHYMAGLTKAGFRFRSGASDTLPDE